MTQISLCRLSLDNDPNFPKVCELIDFRVAQMSFANFPDDCLTFPVLVVSNKGLSEFF